MNKIPRKIKKQLKKAYDPNYTRTHNVTAIVKTHAVEGNKYITYRKPKIIFIKNKYEWYVY